MELEKEIHQILSYHLFYSLGGLLILLTLGHMLYKRRTPTSIISWLLVMIIMPYFFVVLYSVFGTRKRQLKAPKAPLLLPCNQEPQPAIHAIDVLLRSNNIPPSTGGNSLKLYTDGQKAFTALCTGLEQAQTSISLSTYVLKNDPTTGLIFDILIIKARAGVDVRILIDAVGSIGLYLRQKPLRKLKQAGVKIQFFMPLFRIRAHNRINLRYHRKIYIVDQKILFSGGMNLAEEYMGPTPLAGRWDDLLYRTQGPMVSSYVNIFASDWQYSRHTAPTPTTTPCPEKKGDFILQAIPSGPDVNSDALLEAILTGIYNAKKRVWIVTPYFIPNEPILQALRIAQHKGVDVKLITPAESNQLLADLGRSSYMRELHEWGIDVAFYKGAMLHAKAILFDDMVILGSVNLDNRSLLLNYEVVTIAYAQPVVDEMHQWMEKLLQNSSFDLQPASKIRRIFENLMRIFAPQL